MAGIKRLLRHNHIAERMFHTLYFLVILVAFACYQHGIVLLCASDGTLNRRGTLHHDLVVVAAHAADDFSNDVERILAARIV
jgi:hypothetical protein